MHLENLAPPVARRRSKRVGRGIGSGHGKTSTRGQKGQKARAGGVKGPGFEGGQLPLQRRLPRLFRFKNEPFRVVYEVVNVGDLGRFPAGSAVGPDELVSSRLVRRTPQAIKILAKGDLSVALEVSAHAFSDNARRKIEAAGGKATVLGAAADD